MDLSSLYLDDARMVNHGRAAEELESYSLAVGMAIKDLRAGRHTSQEELADSAGLDRTYVSGVERGVRNPTVKSIWKIARALDTTPSSIFTIAEQRLASRGNHAISYP